MLDNIVLKFGEAPDAEPLTIQPGSMTVLVGPNNSGKSLTLREIAQFILNFRDKKKSDWWTEHFKIVASIRPIIPSSGELRDAIIAEVDNDIAPFKKALGAAKIQPRSLIKNFDSGHLIALLNQLNQYGHLRKLAEEQKIDPVYWFRVNVTAVG